MTDKELISRIQEGCELSLQKILTRHRPLIRNVAAQVVKNRHEVDEIEQDVAVTLWRKLHTFEGRCVFQNWLYRVVFNCSVMHLRLKRRKCCDYLADVCPGYRNTLGLSAPVESGPDYALNRKRIVRRVRKCINRLPQREKEAILAAAREGLTAVEIAALKGTTVTAIKCRIHYAKTHLVPILFKEFGTHDPKTIIGLFQC